MQQPETALPLVVEFLRLESSARVAATVRDLGFVIANETHRIVPYRQAFFCLVNGPQCRLETISGLAEVDRATPFHDWFEGLSSYTLGLGHESGPVTITSSDVPDAVKSDWGEWLPEHVLCVFLHARGGEALAMFFLAREEAFSDNERQTLGSIAQVYEHALSALKGKGTTYSRFMNRLPRRRVLIGVAVILLAVMLLPIRQSSLGLAEVTPLTYTSITSPFEGVVASMYVKPNEEVTKGQLLFKLDDTTIRNRLESSRRSMGVAKSEEFISMQKAFMDNRSKADVATYEARVREKGSAIGYMLELLQKMEVRSPADGIVLFGDVADWEGKPVNTGERVMMLADPASAGVTVWVSASNSVNLEPGVKLRLFLYSDPLNSKEATVIRSSFQPVLSPEGIASYRVTAGFDRKDSLPRLGLRGTAKVYGERVSLAYYLFGRPLTSARLYLGL